MNTFQPDGVFAGMALIAVIALAAEFLIAALEKRVLGWRPPSQVTRRRAVGAHALTHPSEQTNSPREEKK